MERGKHNVVNRFFTTSMHPIRKLQSKLQERNGILYNEDGTKRIGNNALVALTLMIAESKTEEMETMVKVVVNLINRDN